MSELIIDEEGNKFWCNGNTFHCENGPACEYINGDKEWWIDGKLHRMDGPAIEYATGEKEWWYEGELITIISQEDFRKQIKYFKIVNLKAFW